MQTKIASLFALLAVLAVSCHKSKQTLQTDAPLPLSAGIIGAWDMVESLELTPEGWKNEALPADYRYIMNYRADGNIEGTLTENGRTGTGVCPYFVDDSQRTIKQMWRTFNVEKLTRDSLVVLLQYSPGPEAKDSITCRCTYIRLENDDYPRK